MMSSPPACSLHSSPSLSSPNVATLLKIKILSWSQETGFPVCIRVRIADRTFNLHKGPLSCRSGYLREKLKHTNEVELPPDFPGGAESFEMMILFMYGSSSAALVDPFNVGALRCAAEFLNIDDNDDDDGDGDRLCQRLDMYLNQVVLQSWSDSLIVLHSCQTLLPWAEDTLIVSRCIETLAFMACMEILDPERTREQPEPVVTLESLALARPWSDRMVRDVMKRDVWIRDMITLPLPFFKRVVASLRRQGMKEKYVTPIILFYAHKWVIQSMKIAVTSSNAVMLQGVIDLLPGRRRSSSRSRSSNCKVIKVTIIPVGFYLSLLSASVKLGLRKDSVDKLQNQIAAVLHLAHPQDLLIAIHDLPLMERVFSTFFHSHSHDPDEDSYVYEAAAVAQLWDLYLNRIASDSELTCSLFVTLIQTLPPSTRQTHDHLYRALNTFFQSHPNLSLEEKGSFCKYLDCHKLSHQVCIEAVQNELMPLRLMVQALFVQQLNTQEAFKQSFRSCGEFSGSLSCTSRSYANSKSQNLGESPYNYIGGGSRSLGLLLQRPEGEADAKPILRKDYESTSFRIENLEKELISLKRSLQLQQMNSNTKHEKKVEAAPITRSSKKKKNQHQNQNTLRSCCIGGTVNFTSQRKYANRILKILQRLTLFARGRGRSNTNTTCN